ncbi:MAG: lipoprotein-releasing system ATP-binding protein [Puniceicoccaceae bacterium 5H]|nr:MAG: lipoprotein-releasing system ATP-binding protein [Puniceicoccaceae bacterium 5H]
MHYVLSVDDIQKRFRSGPREIQVLQGIHLYVRPGESISLRGASGSGKTTLLNIMARMEDADGGTIHWGEREVTAQRSSRLARVRARHLGMVFQSYYLVPELNALQNVVLAGRIGGMKRKEALDRARELMGLVGLDEREHHLPTQLSGGERQRVAVARALVNRPDVLLADEPTGNLDETTGDLIMDLLLKVCQDQQAALVLVTHSRVFAARTERQYELHAGTLHEVGAETSED